MAEVRSKSTTYYIVSTKTTSIKCMHEIPMINIFSTGIWFVFGFFVIKKSHSQYFFVIVSNLRPKNKILNKTV